MDSVEILSSDDELEDTPDFIRNASPMKTPGRSVACTPIKQEPSSSPPPDQPSKLDLLLLERRDENAEEEYLRKTKEELLKNILAGSQEEEIENNILSESLTEEHAHEIEKYETRPSELYHMQPGLCVFSHEKCGCLFDESLTPAQGGFTSNGSSIDKLLVSFKPGTMTLLQWKVLVSCCDKISQLDLVKLWLFFIMSVHSSSLVRSKCFTNLKQLMEIQVLSLENDINAETWCPSPVELLQLLVNLGADPSTLLDQQTLYTPEEIKNCLEPFQESRINMNVSHRRGESLSLVLTVLSICLQARPNLTKEELTVMLHMVATISLDPSLKDCQVELDNCVNNIIKSYSDSDWPEVVPEICRKLCRISSHHHNQMYLARLFYFESRTQLLQASLAYLFLRQQLVPDDSKTLSDDHLLNFEFSDIGWLGKSPDPDKSCTLTSSILHLINKNDVYKALSVTSLLDIAVGSEANRLSKPKEQLQFLIDQVKVIIQSIRNGIHHQDKSKIKDLLSRMKVNWLLTRDETKQLTQRSMFPWATKDSHEDVLEEHVRDFTTPQDIDEDM